MATNQKYSQGFVYLLAILLSLVGVLVKLYWLPAEAQDLSYLLLFTPVVISAWLGGVGPGIFATFLSTILSTYLFIEPKYSATEFLVNVKNILFFLEGTLISLIFGDRNRSQEQRLKLLESERLARLKAEQVTLKSLFLSDASQILSSSIDYKTTLESILNLFVPQIADWCIFDALIGKKFARLAIIHKNPAKQKFADKLKHAFPPDLTAIGGASKVLRTGKPLFYPIVTPAIAKATSHNNPKLLELINKLGLESFIVVPLIARDKILGALSLVISDKNRQYTEEDLVLAKAIANRAALAIDNSILYQHASEEIAKRKKAEDELRKSRDQLDIILQNAADGITVQNTSGEVIYVNDAAAKESGFSSPEAMLKANPLEIVGRFIMMDEKGNVIESNQLPVHQALKGNPQPENLLHFRNLKTGENRWSSVKARPVYDRTGKIILAININHDITARKLLDLQRDTFVSMAGHELRTPVTSIKAYSQLLNKQLSKQLSVQSKDSFLNIFSQLDKLTRIINDLMDIAKMGSNQMDFQDKRFSLDPLIKQAAKDLNKISQTHQVKISGKTGSQVLADKNRIYQVLLNLLTNAVKYSPNSTKVVIHLSKDQKNVTVGIQDFGIGIPKQSQQMVFNSFTRLNNPKNIDIPGTGLGLYISSQIINHYKGKISLESKEEKGSTFSFTLPIIK